MFTKWKILGLKGKAAKDITSEQISEAQAELAEREVNVEIHPVGTSAALADHQSTVQSLTDERDTAQSDLESANDQIETLTGQVASLTQERDQANQRLAVLGEQPIDTTAPEGRQEDTLPNTKKNKSRISAWEEELNAKIGSINQPLPKY